MLPIHRSHLLIIAVFFALSACGGGGGDSTGGATNTAPTASIGTPATGTTYAEGSAVMLTGSATDKEDGTLAGSALAWTSDRDGALGNGATITRALSVGDHVITLTATDSQGQQGTAQIRLTINGRPTLGALTVTPATVTAGTAMTFSWTASDPEGDNLICRLDVDNDGTDEYTIDDCASNTTQVHTYAAAGSYTARLRMDDGINGQRETTVTAMVNPVAPNNSAPVVDAFDGDTSALATGNTVTFSWSVSDADGDTISCELDANGDGTSDYSFTDCTAVTSQSHTYNAAGNYTATLTVTDGNHPAISRGFDLAVSNPPVITRFTTQRSVNYTDVGTVFVWQVSDPDGDTLTCRLDADGDGIDDYTINDCASNSTQSVAYTAAQTYTARMTVTDTISGDVQASHALDVKPSLWIAISAADEPVQAGGRVFYTITVGNVAPIPRNNVRVRMLVPAEVTFHRGNDANPDASCGAPTCSGGMEARWNLGTLEAGGTRTITVNGTVAATTLAGTLVTGDVSVTADGLTDSIQQRRTVRVSSAPLSELSVSAVPDPVQPGDSLTVGVDVGNISTGVLGNVRVRLAVPAGMTVGTISGSGSHDAATGMVTWTLGTVGVGSSPHEEVVLTVPTDVLPGEVLALQAELTHDGGEPVDVVAGHEVTVSGTASPIRVRIDAASEPVQAGGQLFQTITVSNVSLVPVSNVSVLYRVPAEVAFHRINDANPDASCGAPTCSGGMEARWNLGTLEAGGTRTITVNGTVAATTLAGTLVTGDVSVTADGLTDSIQQRRTVRVSSAPLSELSVSAVPDPVQPGDSLTVSVDVGNISTGVLGNVRVRLAVPAGMTVGTISGSGSHDAATGMVSWSLGTLGVGSSPHEEVVLTVPTDALPGEVLALRAELTHDGGEPVDVVAGHEVTVSGAASPVTLVVTTSADPVFAGGLVTYTLTVENRSLVPVNNVSVLYRVPAEVAFQRSNDANPDASCGAPTCSGGMEARWDLGTLNPGTSLSITINALVGASIPAGTLIVASVHATWDGMTDDVFVRNVIRIQP